MPSPNVPPFDFPTLQHLDVDAFSIDVQFSLEQANKWLSAFETNISNQDLGSVISLFHEHGFWKDILTLTWDFRTIRGHSAIQNLLETRLAATGLSAFHLFDDAIRGPVIVKPLPDLVFIRFCFDFETTHGKGTAVVFLIPTSSGDWKAWSLLTCLGALKDHPEKAGALRERLTAHDNWQDRHQRELNFEDGDPAVLVIGAGHGGLETAARLTYLGVSTLVIDKNQRIGDNWRKHYDTLCLHNSIWFNQMPYLHFPKTFPVFCPSPKLADWLESYATALDLNVWMSCSITYANFNQETMTWQVSINRGGKERTMAVKHLVFATGWGGGFSNIPDIPGKVGHHIYFYGRVSREKVIIVGAGTSAHDIAHDLYHEGCDVTMIQRSPTFVISRDALDNSLAERYNEDFPIEFADILGVAFPFPTQHSIWVASTAHTANGMDKDILDGLARVGFRTWLGPDGGGLSALIFERGGGLYIDTGTSGEIINGAIKVKGSPSVRRFTKEGVELEDGTILEGDIVIFATG
ncbi:hypothetical protein JVU11DRAFT_12096 [Chiua virens]|nr:hypothetical protein JVU11DRAFT_12096 [Chiua virens]